MIMIVGCGGTGSWVVRLLQAMREPHLLLVDRDKVEKGNLGRQGFQRRHVGLSKASCLIRKEVDRTMEAWIQEVDFEAMKEKPEWILSCVDNHPARRYILDLSDEYKIPLVLAGNEYEAAEAFVYLPEWFETRRDPRVYYPEIVTSSQDDPTKPTCSGEQAQGNVQSVYANYMAAAQTVRMLSLWRSKAPELKEEDQRHLVNHVITNLYKTEETNYAKSRMDVGKADSD